KDWLAFDIEERNVLCHLPVETDEEKKTFASYLDFLSRRYRGEPVATTVAISNSLWDSALRVPAPVAGKNAPQTPPVTIEEWRRWKSFQGYACTRRRFQKATRISSLPCLKSFVN